MTINDQITRIENAKGRLIQKINEKGVSVPESAKLKDLPAEIGKIAVISNIDFTGTGWEDEKYFPIDVSRIDKLNEDLDYTRAKYAEWDPSTTSLFNKYKDDANLVYAPKIDTSRVTDMAGCFTKCQNLVAVPEWNAVNAKSMSTMMSWCPSLETVTIKNTGSVTNMGYMFYNCTSLKSANLGNTENVADMNSMFFNCSSLKSVPPINTRYVEDMSKMFFGCSSIKSTPKLTTSRVTNMPDCFNGCSNLKSVELAYGVGRYCYCDGMFNGVAPNGVLKIHIGPKIPRESYDPVINVLPPTWTVEEINDL